MDITATKTSLNYLPELIIGLDSLDDDANYIHIDDVKEDSSYYCPCCKGLIKPRAYKNRENYQVQPHFYHVNGGCKKETFVYYICKNWLFVPGCSFIVNGSQYEVQSVEIEKTLQTSFGIYKPDIIVATKSGKVFYFEIKATNPKNELYAPKWDELGNDVVEVDIKYFINQKFKNDIPVFDLIYSDGQCYIKSYTNKSYDLLIGKRKTEWKRQDKLNYKIQWEKLDWFWNELSNYKKDMKTKDNVLESFNAMDIADRIWCYQNIKGKRCIDLKNDLAANINKYYYDSIIAIGNEYDDINVIIEQKSKLVYIIHARGDISYGSYNCYTQNDIRVKCQNKLFIVDIKGIRISYDTLQTEINGYKNAISEIMRMVSLPFIYDIRPTSHYFAENVDIKNLEWVVTFEDNVHNRYLKENIGEKKYKIDSLKERILHHDYANFKKNALAKLEKEIQSYVLLHNTELRKFVEKCNHRRNTIKYCENKIVFLEFDSGGRIDKLQIRPGEVWLADKCLLEVNNDTDINSIVQIVKSKYKKIIRHQHLVESVMKKYMDKINSSKNKAWLIEKETSPYVYYIKLRSSYSGKIIRINQPFSKNSIECQLSEVMNELASGLYGNTRLLEVKA